MKIPMTGLVLALLLQGSVAPTLASQTYGSWDVACDGVLPPLFSAPYVHGVIYGGKEFLTNWRSTSEVRPLPSRNWYQATPTLDVVSRDGTARWHDARVLVHCWIERNPYWMTHHRDPVGFAGVVRACASGGGGSEGDLTPHSPMNSTLGAPTGCSDVGSGSEGEDGSSPEWPGLLEGPGGAASLVCGGAEVLVYDDLCVEVWVTGVGWVTYWCGVGVTCG
jgi:hypothetical protein